MHENNESSWERRTAAPAAPSGLRSTLPSQQRPGLRSTLPSQPAPGETAAASAPAYGHQAQAHAEPRADADQGWKHGERTAVDHGGVDTEKRTDGIKNIIGGAVLIGIGLAFGGSVFLGNPEPIDYFFDGLGSLWVCKGVWDVFSA